MDSTVSPLLGGGKKRTVVWKQGSQARYCGTGIKEQAVREKGVCSLAEVEVTTGALWVEAARSPGCAVKGGCDRSP